MAYASITKPSDYFDTLLYTGDGSATQSISGTSFSPGWIWIKDRDATHDHYSFDSVRTNKKGLEPSDTSAERTPVLGSIDNDGFTFASTDGFYNANGDKYVAWNWKANGAGSSNSDGSITSTVSASTASGFSIIKYTGTGSVGTIGHGLGAKPNVIFQKKLDGATAWTAYHDKFASDPATDYLYLDKSDALADYAAHWNDTEPTSSVITLGTDSSVNGNGNPNIIYAFTEIKGYSKFGKYTGNSSTDGPFIYTGFKPAWVMIKKYSDTANWMIYDNKREGYNVDNDHLKANLGDVEGNSDDLDLLSNGFKLRTSGSGENSGNFIYLAFAAEPLVANVGQSIPATAR